MPPLSDRHRLRDAEREGRRLRRPRRASLGSTTGAAADEPAEARGRRAPRRGRLGLRGRREPGGPGGAAGRHRRGRRRRPLRDPLLQGLPAGGRLPRGAAHQLDGRSRLPAVPARGPDVRYATTCSGYLAHRFTGALRDTAANNILLQWPIDTDTWQWSNDASLYDTFGVAREALAELQLPGDVVGPATAEASAATGTPRRHAGRPDRERQGRGGARGGPAGRAGRARLARHLHRRDGARQREPPGAGPFLDELRLSAAPLPLREPRHPARDVDADVVPRPARRRGRRAGGLAGPRRASATSSKRPRRPRPEATG